MPGKRKSRLLPHHRKFALAVASGMTGAQAYRKHVARGPTTRASACQSAYELLRNPEVALIVGNQEKSVGEWMEREVGFGRRQVARQLMEVWQTPIGEVDANHWMAQEKTEVTTSNGEDQETTVTKIKMVGKMDALEKLAKMAGWYPQSQSTGAAIPAIVINLGAMYSPALGEESGNKGKTMEMQTIAVRSLSG